MLWGLLRGVRIEAPRSTLGAVDMSIEAPVEELVVACDLARALMAEIETAFRHGLWHTPRLARSEAGTWMPGSFRGGSGMITGGLGG